MTARTMPMPSEESNDSLRGIVTEKPPLPRTGSEGDSFVKCT